MRLKHILARGLRRFPFFAFLIFWLYRFSVPRFTAGVAGVLFDDQGRILLVEHVYHARHPWGLPGGWLGRDEQPDFALRREFAEETRLAVEIVAPVLVETGVFWRHHLDVGYLVRLREPGQAIMLSHELRDYAWVAPQDVLTTQGYVKGFHRRVVEHALAQMIHERG
ncbi:MAG: NUDIX domain-containing protein [Anaerolineales bacterium]